jgi:DNA-binding winged helix-turn-helix (wHTH) protein
MTTQGCDRRQDDVAGIPSGGRMKADSVVDLALARDLVSVTHPDGTQLHFTRQERALLIRLINTPGRLLRRPLLAEAVNGLGEDPVSERHVDYLINQLRRKLRDNARSPRFIQTQYGEGYLWIGDVRRRIEEEPALLRIGPIFGGQLPEGLALVDRLAAAVAARLEPGKMAARDQAPRGHKSNFALEASLYDGGQRLQAALVLRDERTSAILATYRITSAADDATIATTADAVTRAMWSSTALPSPASHMPPSEPPPWVRLFEAALLMDGDLLTWKSNGERLKAILANEPDNAVMEVMRGLNLYTWLIQSFYDPSGEIVGQAQWKAVEDEIENIALDALARFDDQPIMQLAAAKLLLFVSRGYLHMVCRIADDLLERTSAHAAAFALAGEAHGFAGDIERGTALLERALELSEVGSHFHVYLLVVEATAIFAGSDRAGFDRICDLTRTVAPEAYETLRAFCALPGFEQSPLFGHVLARDATRAAEALRFLWNVSGRRFARRDHRRNFMRPMTAAMVERYGPDVIPDEVDFGTGLRTELTSATTVIRG